MFNKERDKNPDFIIGKFEVYPSGNEKIIELNDISVYLNSENNGILICYGKGIEINSVAISKRGLERILKMLKK